MPEANKEQRTDRPVKPLGIQNYGSIGHLPGSNTGPADHTINDGQSRILTEKCRRGDTVIVREKLDGTNVGVARVGDELIALQRKGYRCDDSPYFQHKMFAEYVRKNARYLRAVVGNGERICGEWCLQAHGTRYRFEDDDLFFAFDIFGTDGKRIPDEQVEFRCGRADIPMPALIHRGDAIAVDDVMCCLGPFGHHNAIDLAEGAVWRVEGQHGTDILAKYVRPEKIPGLYLPGVERFEVYNREIP